MERPCICEGNLRDIIAEYEPKFGTVYNTERGTYKLIGIAICKDDYYYLLQSTHDYMYPRSLYISCCCSLEQALRGEDIL